jgi:hypothetical protein
MLRLLPLCGERCRDILEGALPRGALPLPVFIYLRGWFLSSWFLVLEREGIGLRGRRGRWVIPSGSLSPGWMDIFLLHGRGPCRNGFACKEKKFGGRIFLERGEVRICNPPKQKP